jgi:hypothetical protein
MIVAGKKKTDVHHECREESLMQIALYCVINLPKIDK